jgi:hypothetical protein
MNLNTTRHLRAFAIAAIPLFLIAGAAFAESGHVSLLSDPTSGPTAGATEAVGASGSPVVAPTSDEKELKASESPEATKAPEANESAEPSKAPEASESDSAKDQDVDEGPGASAGTQQGEGEGRSGGGSGDGDGHGKVGQPGPSGAPTLGGGAPGFRGGDH